MDLRILSILTNVVARVSTLVRDQNYVDSISCLNKALRGLRARDISNSAEPAEVLSTHRRLEHIRGDDDSTRALDEATCLLHLIRAYIQHCLHQSVYVVEDCTKVMLAASTSLPAVPSFDITFMTYRAFAHGVRALGHLTLGVEHEHEATADLAAYDYLSQALAAEHSVAKSREATKYHWTNQARSHENLGRRYHFSKALASLLASPLVEKIDHAIAEARIAMHHQLRHDERTESIQDTLEAYHHAAQSTEATQNGYRLLPVVSVVKNNELSRDSRQYWHLQQQEKKALRQTCATMRIMREFYQQSRERRQFVERELLQQKDYRAIWREHQEAASVSSGNPTLGGQINCCSSDGAEILRQSMREFDFYVKIESGLIFSKVREKFDDAIRHYKDIPLQSLFTTKHSEHAKGEQVESGKRKKSERYGHGVSSKPSANTRENKCKCSVDYLVAKTQAIADVAQSVADMQYHIVYDVCDYYWETIKHPSSSYRGDTFDRLYFHIYQIGTALGMMRHLHLMAVPSEMFSDYLTTLEQRIIFSGLVPALAAAAIHAQQHNTCDDQQFNQTAVRTSLDTPPPGEHGFNLFNALSRNDCCCAAELVMNEIVQLADRVPPFCWHSEYH